MSEIGSLFIEADVAVSDSDILIANHTVLLLRDYLSRQPPTYSKRNYSGNCLGIQTEIDRRYSVYELACRAFNLRHCNFFGKDLGIKSGSGSSQNEIKNIIFKQMDGLVSVGEPMVFFVPPKLGTFECSGRTRFEMEYLTYHAGPNIDATFVLGAYSENGRRSIENYRARYQ